MNQRPMFLAVMDPPWVTDNGGGGRGANSHYELNTVEGIAKAVRASGLWRTEGPALVWMWATSTALLSGSAHKLALALDLRVCAGFIWAKVDRRGGGFGPPAQPGLGQWSRCEHEHLLVCRRGKKGEVKVPAPAVRQRSVIYAKRGKHSAKPAEAWDVIEQTSIDVCGHNSGVEFFARSGRPGWYAWGKEAPPA